MAQRRLTFATCLVILVLLASATMDAQARASMAAGTPPVEPTAAPIPTAPPTPIQRPTLPAARIYLPLLFTVQYSGGDSFWADRYALKPGECTTIHWSTTSPIAVYLNDMPVTGQGTAQVCPANTNTYVLRVEREREAREYRVTIVVDAGNHLRLAFSADAYQIQRGECTTLRWRVTEARGLPQSPGSHRRGRPDRVSRGR